MRSPFPRRIHHKTKEFLPSPVYKRYRTKVLLMMNLTTCAMLVSVESPKVRVKFYIINSM